MLNKSMKFIFSATFIAGIFFGSNICNATTKTFNFALQNKTKRPLSYYFFSNFDANHGHGGRSEDGVKITRTDDDNVRLNHSCKEGYTKGPWCSIKENELQNFKIKIHYDQYAHEFQEVAFSIYLEGEHIFYASFFRFWEWFTACYLQGTSEVSVDSPYTIEIANPKIKKNDKAIMLVTFKYNQTNI